MNTPLPSSGRRSLWLTWYAVLLAPLLIWQLRAADTAPPTVTAVLPPPSSTVNTLSTLRIFFSEPVNGLVVDDLLLNGHAARAVSGEGAAWVFQFEEPPVGKVSLAWDPGSDIRDLAGNRFVPDNTGWSYQFIDNLAPDILRITPSPGTPVQSLTEVEILFSEPMTGLQASDLFVNHSSAIGIDLLSPTRARFHLPPLTPGPVTFQWASVHQIEDLHGNPFHGTTWSSLLDPQLEIPALRINEFVASNLSGLLDENNSPEDWIEIYNPTAKAVSLLGWTLTNDRDDLARWSFPSTNLPPAGFLIVFASAKNRATPGAKLHTNFKINPAGGYLGLAWNGRVASEVKDYPEQRGNFSFGLDDQQILRYFAAATPGATNSGNTVGSILAEPHASVRRGLFEQAFTLYLTSEEPNASIRYTLDGSEPSLANGFPYRGSMVITQTTTLRFAAFQPGRLPSGTVTHTYLFPDSTLRQSNKPSGIPAGSTLWGGYPTDFEMDPEIVTNSVYGPLMKQALEALPALCISIPVEEMFGASRGLYTHTEERGPTWERACSAEWIPQDGTGGFQVNCGVQIQGNANRTPQKNPKHAMRLTFKGDYGPSSLDYPLFPDSPVTRFDTLVLRSDFNFGWLHWSGAQRSRGQRTRDAWMKDSMRAMGGLASHNRYCHLYINGLYWGIYDPSERPDGAFAASYLGGEKEDWDVINEGAAVDGTMNAYNAMLGITQLQRETNYVRMQRALDVPRYIDYILLHYYVGHQDWGDVKNWYAARPKSGATGFQYIPWDGENILDVDVNYNRVAAADEPSGLQARLVANPEYRIAFGDRVHHHFFHGGALSSEAVIDRWMRRAKQVELAIVAESARWGDYRRDVQQFQDPPFELYTRDNQWRAEQNRLVKSYFPARGAIVLKQLQAAGLYPKVTAPNLVPYGGSVPFGTIAQLFAPTGSIYFTLDGTDPRTYGTGSVASNAIPYLQPLSITHSVTVKARVLVGTNWSALEESRFAVESAGTPLRVTELMFQPPGGNAYEFVELKNLDTLPTPVGGYSFQGIDYTFPPGTVLDPGQVLVLGSDENRSNWLRRYPSVTPFGWFGGSLANRSERLTLRDAELRPLWTFTYGGFGVWPNGADATGFSIELLDPAGNPDDPAQWRTSLLSGGSPGTVPSRITPSVQFNEVMASGMPGFSGFIELFNPGSLTLDLADWTITEDLTQQALRLPSGTRLEGHQWLLIPTGLPISHNAAPGFPLPRSGGSLRLLDPASNRVDAISYGRLIAGFSIGRLGDTWTLNLPTPGGTNLPGPVTLSSPLRINEWMANSRPGESDWIEIWNSSTQRVAALQGLTFETGSASAVYPWIGFLEPGGFLEWKADEQPGPDHLGLKLSAGGDTLRLRTQEGFLINTLDYPAQSEGVSMGRLPDGSSELQTFPLPSPAASNQLPPVVAPELHEILTSNQRDTVGTNKKPDWIELFNPTAASFPLEGFTLRRTDKAGMTWTFPAGSIIAAGGYLVITCTDELPASTAATPATLLNTGFPLEISGCDLEWVTPSGRVIERLKIGMQIENLSIGRSAGSAWELLETPTPGGPNAAPAQLGSVVDLRINEWSATRGSSDFVELYQTGVAPVSLAGLRLTDNLSLGGISSRPIPPLSFIGGRNFAYFKADGDPERGASHLDLRLDAAGESIRLLDTNLVTLDAVFFGSTPLGHSFGRLPDGVGPQVLFSIPTPGTENQADLTFSEVPRSVEASLGSAVRFSAVAATLLPPLQYQWFHDGQIVPGETSSTLVLPAASESQEGSYTVVVSDQAKHLESPPALLTLYKPARVLLSPPPVVNVATGSTLSLTLTSAGSLPIRYRWFRGAVEVTNILSESAQSTLTLSNLKTAQAGRYFCVLSNLATSLSVTSGVSVVNVLVPPLLLSPLTGGEFEPGSDVRLTINAAGSSLSYTWTHNGDILSAETNNFLLLPQLQSDAAGFYSVAISNAVGIVRSSEVRVTLKGAPSLEIVPLHEKVLIRWTSLPGKMYRVQVSNSVQPSQWSDLVPPILASGTDTNVEDSLGLVPRYYRVVLEVP